MQEACYEVVYFLYNDNDIFINLQLRCRPVVIHIYTQTIHRTTQITTNLEECGPCPIFANFTLAFALRLREKHGKTSVRLRKTSEYKNLRVSKCFAVVGINFYKHFSHCFPQRRDAVRCPPSLLLTGFHGSYRVIERQGT
jgi:hypothetical protein